MDRPNNLMQVRALMWFDGEPDLVSLREVVRERLIERHPVFRRRAVQRRDGWYWEDDEDFDLANHVREVRLDGDEEELRRWMAERFAEPMATDRPMWDTTLVHGIEGWGTVLFARFHHALADGVRLTQLMFSLCDPADGEVRTVAVGRARHEGGVFATGTKVVRQGMDDLADFAVGSMRWPLRTVSQFSPRSMRAGLGVLRDPRRLMDVVSGVSSTDNLSVNTAVEVTRALSARRSARASWSGVPGVEKQLSWVRGLELARVKEVGRAHEATVNDVLLAIVSRAITRYLADKGTPQREIAWLVPVSLLPFDDNLPEELGNHFSLVFVPMPLGQPDLPAAIAQMQERMQRLKNSLQPVITFGVQWMIAQTPQAIAYRLTNFFANKSVGVLTNVPGPRQPLTLAGVPAAGVLGWAPTSGDQPLSLCIFSYNGEVSVGIAADATLIPDPELLAEFIREELDEA